MVHNALAAPIAQPEGRKWDWVARRRGMYRARTTALRPGRAAPSPGARSLGQQYFQRADFGRDRRRRAADIHVVCVNAHAWLGLDLQLLEPEDLVGANIVVLELQRRRHRSRDDVRTRPAGVDGKLEIVADRGAVADRQLAPDRPCVSENQRNGRAVALQDAPALSLHHTPTHHTFQLST